ncbi:MAG: DMT family transporter [Succinivibrionaceae bacterium]
MINPRSLGHLLALLTVIGWSFTYISTKCLLDDFTPIEILITRFILGLIALKIIYPKAVKFNYKEEPYYILSGLTGVCMYFLIENYALTLTTACNVSIILAITPIFTAITNKIFYPRDEKLSIWFFLGFVAAITGIIILSTRGNELSFNPLGDSLAVLAGIIWSIYSVVSKKINTFGYNAIQVTRRSIAYGIMFMLPLIPFSNHQYNYEAIFTFQNSINFLFLGLIASAICFTTWNAAVKILGPISTIVYLYATPVFSVILCDLILNEKLTVLGWIASFIIMSGLVISQKMIPILYNKILKIFK